MTDIVGLSTDVSGIVMEVSVHDSQKIAQKAANGDVLFKLAPCSFNWTWLRHRSEYANDFLALQGRCRSTQEPERLEFLN
jgi:membrane fusion protein (multidrug efflux system)